MASTYLSKTYGSAGNRKTMTFSFWIKRGNLSTAQHPMSIFDSGSGNQADMRFDATTDVFRMYSTDTSGTPFAIHLVTDRVFRDTSAWYHMVWEIDTTQATASDRVKLYVNGVRETSFSTETYPAQNTDLRWNGTSGSAGGVTQIGAINGNGVFDGSMAHFHFIDGTAYDADTFGETDATTGIWKPKTAPSVTYGTNGFFLKFENSGAFGTDSSGNANNFTVNGTMTQTIDTPSNNFATGNALLNRPTYGWATLSEGNLKHSSAGLTNSWGGLMSNIIPSAGKWYAEVYCQGGNSGVVGVGNAGTFNVDHFLVQNPQGQTGFWGIQWNSSGSRIENGSIITDANVTNFMSNGIVGIALDCDNQELTMYINGSVISTVNGLDISNTTSTDAFAFMSLTPDGGPAVFNWNFGNGYFGTTAVSSAQNPDDGIGIFEYDVPTGYKALCTKSINAQEYD